MAVGLALSLNTISTMKISSSKTGSSRGNSQMWGTEANVISTHENSLVRNDLAAASPDHHITYPNLSIVAFTYLFSAATVTTNKRKRRKGDPITVLTLPTPMYPTRLL